MAVLGDSYRGEGPRVQASALAPGSVLVQRLGSPVMIHWRDVK